MKDRTNIYQLLELIERSDAIMIGAGAGLSSAAGLTYDGERFHQYFSDFIERYHVRDMYSAGFYPYDTLEEFWAYWSRYIYVNRYVDPPKPTYALLKELVEHKPYFVLTTNVDHQFQRAGFDSAKLFYTQGDYGLWQCSIPCHDKVYENKDIVEKMVKQQKDFKVPTQLVPHCPICGAAMSMNLRSDETFVEPAGWHKAMERYEAFVDGNKHKNILYLELGVGFHTPGIIKYPLWQYTLHNPLATYVSINPSEAMCPDEIRERSLLIREDIHEVLTELKKLRGKRV